MPKGVYEREPGRPRPSRQGVSISPEHRVKIIATMARPDVRAQMSAAHRGQPLSREHRAAQSAGMRGNTNFRGNPKGTCSYCGGVATQWDHVIPRVRGGCHAVNDDHSFCDRVLACGNCNYSKRDRTPEQWLDAGLYGGNQR